MTPYWMSRIGQLTGAVIVAGLRFAGPANADATAASLPKDPCALLKPAEIQAALAPGATVGAGVRDTSGLPLGVGCTFTWGPRTSGWGQSALTITVIDASKAWPGTSRDNLKQGLLAKAAAGGPNASVISGVGDAGAFTYEGRSYNATAEAYFGAKNVDLSVQFHDGGSLQQKAQVIALLKEAGARL